MHSMALVIDVMQLEWVYARFKHLVQPAVERLISGQVFCVKAMKLLNQRSRVKWSLQLFLNCTKVT